MSADNKETKKLTPEEMELLRQNIKTLEEKLAGVDQKLRFLKARQARQALAKQLPAAHNRLALAEIKKAKTAASEMLNKEGEGAIAQADKSGEYTALESAFNRFIKAIKALCKLQPNTDMSSEVDTIEATFTSYKNWQNSGRTTQSFHDYYKKEPAEKQKQETAESFKPVFPESNPEGESEPGENPEPTPNQSPS